MKRRIHTMLRLSLIIIWIYTGNISAQKVYTSYLWHMDQPVYWPDKSIDKPQSRQYAEESQRLKLNGTNNYPESPVAHPTNNLEAIFSKADRVNAYQTAPRNAISSIKHLPNAGAQLSISGGLLENIQSLANKNQWGYHTGWMDAYKEAIGWKTSSGFPRLDVVNFTFDHALSPLISERTLIKQIKTHQYILQKYYNTSSKGYWPAECAFSVRIIKALVECGIEWSVIANSHLARTLSDYQHPYNINGNIEAPNRADKIETTGENWFDGVIDGRGCRLAVPYAYQVHKAQYIDPSSGESYLIDVIPMDNYLSYVDGYSGANVSEVLEKIDPYSNTSKPCFVLLAHDGDNAWGGGSSYYNQAVSNFTNSASTAGFEPTTIQQFLTNHPTPLSDIVHVEDGAWVNAANDWGHPQFINWLWPLHTQDYRFDPNGWTEDARNWSVITATENYVKMAEDLEGGNLNIAHIAEGGTIASNAEKAWHFYFGGLNSGFMYYGKAEDMEVKPSLAGNIAIEYAQKVIDEYKNTDQTAPSVFIPQRFPYNPGEIGFSPYTGYKKVNYSSDFHVWTFAYDVSGLSDIVLKYRIDDDGHNPVASIQNELYNATSEVQAWQTITMTRRPMAPDPSDDGELDFFIQPKAKADLCYAEITGYKDKLIDYYVEATDTKGNVFKTPIQHVYVGTDNGNPTGSNSNVEWNPEEPTSEKIVTISCANATSASKLHWGVNGKSGQWILPVESYRPAGTTLFSSSAAETPFKKVAGKWIIELGPFHDANQEVNSIDFVINHGNDNWDNNDGNDYKITVSQIATEHPQGKNITLDIAAAANYCFSTEDFGFYSPIANTLKGIWIESLPATGVLKLSENEVSVGQLIENVSSLIYHAGNKNASFTYKITDSQNLVSKTSYTVRFNILNENAIQVGFKKPEDWNSVYIWAWNDGGNIFPSWPGVPMTSENNDWYVYTFNKTISNVNIVFSNNGSLQTVDIKNITSDSCFESSGIENNKITVKVTSCGGILTLQPNNREIYLPKMCLYPQPTASNCYISLPYTSYHGKYKLDVYGLDGRRIKSIMLNADSLQFDCSDIPQGIYHIALIKQNSGEFYHSKLIIK